MMKRLRQWINDQRFRPTPAGLLVNRDYIIRRSLWQAVQRHSRHFTGRILDFGCGEQPYRCAFPASEYVGVEIAVSGHDPTKKKADVFYDGHTLPFPSASFDGVITFEVFQAVPNPERMLAEIARVLKPGGFFLLTYPYAWEEVEMPYDLVRYTSAGLQSHLGNAGLETVSLEKTPAYLATLTQMFTLWLSHTLLPWRSFWLRQLSTLLIIAPINLAGLILSRLLPKDERYFHNVVILARRRTA